MGRIAEGVVREVPGITPEAAEEVALRVSAWRRRWKTNPLDPKGQSELAKDLICLMRQHNVPVEAVGGVRESIREFILFLFRKLDIIWFHRNDTPPPRPFAVTPREARSLMYAAGFEPNWFRAPGRNITSYTCQGDVLEWALESPGKEGMKLVEQAVEDE